MKITRYTLVYDNLQDDDAGEWVKHSDHEAALKAAVAAEAKATVNARRLELHARLLCDAISHLPEGLEGYLESLDEPIADLLETLAAVQGMRARGEYK